MQTTDENPLIRSEATERHPPDPRTDEQFRLDRILDRLSGRDRVWLRELVATEAGATLLLNRI
jgi:hypothetical protein